MSFRDALGTTVRVAIGTLLVACSSDSATTPVTPPVTLSQALSEIASVSDVGGRVTLMGGPLLPNVSWAPERCSYTAASQSFVCPPIVEGGVTITRSFTLLSASGAPQSAFDPATTDAVRTVTTTVGSMGPAGDVVTIDHKLELTLSGLLRVPHVVNGVGTAKLSGRGTGGERFTMTSAGVITNLVLPPRAAGANAWPTSGTIAIDGTFETTGMPTDRVRLEVAFTGTSRVQLTITSGGRTSRCTVDLATSLPACM